MSERDKKIMTKYNITSESKMIYRYKEHRYENLIDAVRYAKLDTSDITGQESNSNVPTEQ